MPSRKSKQSQENMHLKLIQGTKICNTIYKNTFSVSEKSQKFKVITKLKIKREYYINLIMNKLNKSREDTLTNILSKEFICNNYKNYMHIVECVSLINLRLTHCYSTLVIQYAQLLFSIQSCEKQDCKIYKTCTCNDK